MSLKSTNWARDFCFCIGLLGCATSAYASRQPKSVSLNGGTSWKASPTNCTSCSASDGGAVTVCPGSTVSVALQVTTSGSGSANDWQSTGWTVEGSSKVCVDTANHTGSGTFTETFNITAPGSPGTYDLTLDADAADGLSCPNSDGGDILLVDAITVLSPLQAPCCTPSAGNDATCNGIDDDCDGLVDEDAVSCTHCGDTVDACIYLMIDRTGSTTTQSLGDETNAATTFLHNLEGLLIPPPVAIGAFGCNGSGFPANGAGHLGYCTGNADDACTLQALSNTEVPAPYGDDDGSQVDGDHFSFVEKAGASMSSTGTHFACALDVVNTELAHGSCPANKKKILVFLSDGGDQDAQANTLAAATHLKSTHNVEIFALLFPPSGGVSLADQQRMQDVASLPTSTHYFFAPTSADIAALFDSLTQQITCNDNNPCTSDACSNFVCVYTPLSSSATCELDGNPCTIDHCNGSGTCVNSGVVTCPGSTGPCNAGQQCNPLNGLCENLPPPAAGTPCDLDSNPCTTDQCDGSGSCTFIANNSNLCNDNNACTSPDVCTAGVCTGTSLNCNDNNSCTDDGCNPASGCFHTNNSNPCNDANACTTGDMCSGGVCVGGPAPVCDDGNVCTTDGCDPATGCTHTNNSASCNDGNACTMNDTCSSGICAGSPVNCDDGNICTTDGCDPGSGCTHTNNTVSCNDGNACTTNDTCSAGSCTGSPLNCDDGNICTDDSCNPAVGCTYSFNGNPCDDGMPCTDGDVCVAGSCQGTPNGLICCDTDAQCDEGNVCTTDACSGGVCVWTFNSNPCSDGSACTTGDVCVMGACSGGPPTDCNDGNVCTDDSCNPTTGCIHLNNTAPCDDGSACTTFDTCSGGACVGGPPPDCNDNNVCTDDGCNPATGCFHTNNASLCDDGNACTTSDTCAGGGCVGGPAPSCDDGNFCTDDFCDTMLGCQHADNSLPCNDSDACTTLDTCANGGCVGGPALVCNDGNICTTDSCDSGSGCVYTNNTDPCDDGNACTNGDACLGGSCVGGPAPVCDDGNGCTTDSCDPGSGCIFANNTDPCDDGNACTTMDKCLDGQCSGGPPLFCDDDNFCTDDACDSGAGCVHSFNSNVCDDGHGCTSGDVCVNGQCVGQPELGCTECTDPSVCNDGNPCTTDTCSGGVCVFTNNTSSCDDGNACTINDVCANGSCLGGPPLDCDDGNGCTTDLCNPTSGCDHVNNSNACDDGNACTTKDRCVDGACTGGAPPDCDDGNICTSDACNPATGCTHADNSLPCDDGNVCTTGETCSGGACAGGLPLDCNDNNICTDDSCNPAIGCVHTDNAEPCDDGNACTTNDLCSGGSCVSGPAPDCDDGNVCTDDACNPATGCTHTGNANGCSDGNPCTTPDVCMGGGCVSGPPVVCDDGDMCNDPDLCVGGACTHGPSPNCDDQVTCTVDSCDPATGSCVHEVTGTDCAIPTMSQWGLLVLGLLLLIGSKVHFGRRSEPAPQ